MGVAQAEGLLPAGTASGPPSVTIHDLATLSPLQLSKGTHEALTGLLSGLPADTLQAGVTFSSEGDGALGAAIGYRVGDSWVFGAAVNKKLKGGPLEAEVQLSWSPKA